MDHQKFDSKNFSTENDFTLIFHFFKFLLKLNFLAAGHRPRQLQEPLTTLNVHVFKSLWSMKPCSEVIKGVFCIAQHFCKLSSISQNRLALLNTTQHCLAFLNITQHCSTLLSSALPRIAKYSLLRPALPSILSIAQ